jgi:hypothetical protein
VASVPTARQGIDHGEAKQANTGNHQRKAVASAVAEALPPSKFEQLQMRVIVAICCFDGLI